MSGQCKKPHSLIPCLLTDQNFKNYSEKGHSRHISMRLFHNLTNSFREDFLGICLCSCSQVAPIHQSHVHGRIKISLTFLREEHFCELGIRSNLLCCACRLVLTSELNE